ncbi:9274_t:CDS:2, partial [Acaulospora colombiana]
GLPPTSDPDVTSSNLGSYEYPTSYAPILQPTPVSAEAQYQVQDLLGSNPSLNTGTQLTPRANPPPDLPNAFSRTPTIHGPFPPQTSHPSIPPQEIAASAKNKATISSNEGFASNLKKKFSTSSTNIIRRVSDMKDKEAELARPTKSRQYWPSKYEAEVFTEEDMKLPAAKRRRIYINSLEQYCNTLNELMRVHGLLAEPKPFAKE